MNTYKYGGYLRVFEPVLMFIRKNHGKICNFAHFKIRIC